MSDSRRRGGRRGFIAPAAVVAIVAAALTAVGFGVVGLARPQAAPITYLPRPSSSAAAAPSTRPAVLGRSIPIRLTIAAIGVDAGLQRLGLSADRRTVQLPPSRVQAGWFEQSATPGEAGPTIIVGYIARHRRPGVFARLAALHIGAHITVRRADGVSVVYQVDRIAGYPEHGFPLAQVYSRTRTSTIRIITCGGTLRPGQERGNAVVYGHQLAVQRFEETR